MLSITTEGDITYWHTSTKKILYTLKEFNNTLLSLDYNITGSLFAVGCEDKTIKIYDENMKVISHKIPSGSAYSSGHMSRINSICFGKSSEYENLIVSGSWDQRINIYDIRTKKFVATFLGPYITGDSIDITNNLIMTGSSSSKNNLQFWDIRNLKEFFKSNIIPDYGINCLQFSKNNVRKKIIVACGTSSLEGIKIYKFCRETGLMTDYVSTRFIDKPIYTVDFAGSGEFLSFSGADGNIRIVNL